MKNGLAPSVVKWLSRVAPGSKRSYRENFGFFMKWLEENGDEFDYKSPDELVSYMENASRKEQYKLLDLIQDYISSLKGLRLKTVESRYIAIRSFFKHNRSELPQDPDFKIRADIPPVKGTLTIEDVRDIVKASTPAYRAVFLSMFQGGMGLEEFEYWNLHGWYYLQKDLEENARFITVDLPGRKKKRHEKPYSTFIGGDAKDALLDYLPHRKTAMERFDRIQKLKREATERRGEEYIERKFNPNAIIYNNWGSPIIKGTLYNYWFRKCVKLGIVKPNPKDPETGNGCPGNRYGKNPHEMRDLFRSQWEKSPAKESIGEYMMGHQIDPLEYNKAFRDTKWVKGEIRKALPMLQIMSSQEPFGLVDKEEYDRDYEQLNEKLRKTELRIAELRAENERQRAEYEALKESVKEEIMWELGLRSRS